MPCSRVEGLTSKALEIVIMLFRLMFLSPLSTEPMYVLCREHKAARSS